jgi:hypothetical protein
MKHRVKLLTVVEIDVDSEMHAAVHESQAILDAFREAALPSENCGVTIYRATPNDLCELLRCEAQVLPLLQKEDDKDFPF